jgi:hypothetical protein
MKAALVLLIMTVVGRFASELYEQRVERLERLNRESWQVLRSARRIHDETAAALETMFDEARTPRAEPRSGRATSA